MGYAANHHQPSVIELARSGNFRAIAYWLNVFLLPHNVFAQVCAAQKPGCLKIVVEFHPQPNQNPNSQAFRKSMVRFICRHIWQLNSEVIDGVQVIAKYIEKPQVLWRQSVRVISPARRQKLALLALETEPAAAPATAAPAIQSLKSRLKIVTRQRVQFRAMRSLLLTGTTAAAFILGCWVGYSDSPDDQKTASAASSTRPDAIATVLEKVKVEKLEGNPNTQDVSLIFGGNVALNEAYSNLVGDDQQWAFSALEEYRQADVAMVNLEAPFTRAEQHAPDQASPTKMNPANVSVLKNGGVDLVNLANNRTMDYKTAGLKDTLSTLEQAGIRSVGAGLDAKEARRPEIVEVKGQRIAYLGYHDSELFDAEANKAGLNSHPSDRIAADIQALRQQVDWIIVNYHWDESLEQRPSDRQVELARATIDHGADLVVGHHSEMLQGAELYKGRPIVYSLGSFIFGEQANSDYDTAVLKVALNSDRQMKVEMLPVEVKGFQPRVVHGERAEEILTRIASASEQFKQPLKPSVVLDTRSNTIVPDSASESPAASPDAQPTDSMTTPASPEATESPAPDASESSAPEAGEPFTPDAQMSAPQPTDSPAQAPASELNSSPADASTPAAQPTPESAAPAPDAAPESQSVPSSSQPGDSQPEAPKHPWGNNPFLTDPNAQPSPGAATFGEPMVPQQPTPTISPDQQGDASTGAVPLHALDTHPSAHSLEPMKRRYATHPPGELAPISLAPNL